MSEKLLWKGWWIMIINTAALMHLMQVCILVMLMTFITFTYWTRHGDFPCEYSGAERKPSFLTTMAIVAVHVSCSYSIQMNWLPFIEYLLQSASNKVLYFVLFVISSQEPWTATTLYHLYHFTDEKNSDSEMISDLQKVMKIVRS